MLKCAGFQEAHGRWRDPAAALCDATHLEPPILFACCIFAVQNPKKRATADEILQHPWLKKQGVASDKPLDNVILKRLG